MDDEEDEMMLQDHNLIPERDVNGGGIMDNIGMGVRNGGNNFDGDPNMFDHSPTTQIGNSQHLGTQAEAAFNQQRVVVSRLSREEIEDRYLRLLEENVVIKKHACKQEEKIKKLATKLIRVLSDKKRLEMAGGGGMGGGTSGARRDIETEELIEDQQQKIRELERQTTHLKEKLLVAKQQLLAVNSGGRTGAAQNRRNLPRAVAHPMVHQRQQAPMAPGSHLGHGSPSPVPLHMQTQQHAAQLLSQQAHQLLEEAQQENRMLEDTVATLKEQVNIFEQEVEQIREQSKIKEANFEEEITILKEQVKDRECQTVTENIELIRLQQDKKNKSGQITTLKSQLQGLEENLNKLKVDEQNLVRENANLNELLQEEQKRTIALNKEVASNSSAKQALLESEVKSRDLQRENAILRESNEKLLDSAYNVERERSFVASENALKVQVAQLESTLKADLNDKKNLTELLAKERESYATLEAEYKDLQSKFFNLKEASEGQEEKLQFFAKENSVSSKDLEEALLILRNKQIPTMSDGGGSIDMPSFLSKTSQDDHDADLKTELSELQVRHVEAVNELEKTRSLLKAQAGINKEQKNEVEALQNRLQQVKAEFQSQLSEYKKLLDMRAARIKKLELQMRETAYGAAQKLTESQLQKTTTIHTPSGQSLFEIHMLKAHLTKEILINLGSMEPKIFLTWTFYDHSMQYTPVIAGPEATFDCSAYYKVKLDDAFLEYLSSTTVQVSVHLVLNKQDCKSIALAEVSLQEVLDYPSNKLHGSVMLKALSKDKSGIDTEKVIGSLDYWFKLHTAAIHRIRQWQDHKSEVEKVIENNMNKPEAYDEEFLVKTQNEKLIQQPPLQNIVHPPTSDRNMYSEPKPAPRMKTVADRPRVREETFVKSTSKEKESSDPNQVGRKEKAREDQESLSRKSTPKSSFDRTSEVVKDEEHVSIATGSAVIERNDDLKKTTSSSPSLEKKITIDSQLSKNSKNSSDKLKKSESSKESQKDEVRRKPQAEKELDVDKKEEKQQIHEHKKQQGQKQSSLPPLLKQTDEKDISITKSKSLSPPIPKPRGSPTRKVDSLDTQIHRGKQKHIDIEEPKQTPKYDLNVGHDAKKAQKQASLQKIHAQKTLTAEQDSEESSRSEEASEESDLRKRMDNESEEEEEGASQTESETGEEEEDEDSNEDERSEDEESQAEENDEEGSATDDNSEAEDDDENESDGNSSDEPNEEVDKRPSKDLIKSRKSDSAVKHEAEIHHGPARDLTPHETSQDSEGVVMLKSPTGSRKTSGTDKDKMSITIIEFKAAKGAKFLKNKNIEKLYVEYKFLDLPPEELETPSFPKPKAGGDSFKLNFTKIISIDRTIHSKRRRKLAKMLTSEPTAEQVKEGVTDSTVVFTLVSEPPEDKEDQDCEDVGIAKIDLRTILSTGQDIVDMTVDVMTSETQSRVSRLLNTGNKPIATLIISIEASEAFKSMRLK